MKNSFQACFHNGDLICFHSEVAECGKHILSYSVCLCNYDYKLSRRGGGGFGGRGRRIVEYHDLDAPADMEF